MSASPLCTQLLKTEMLAKQLGGSGLTRLKVLVASKSHHYGFHGIKLLIAASEPASVMTAQIFSLPATDCIIPVDPLTLASYGLWIYAGLLSYICYTRRHCWTDIARIALAINPSK